MINLHKLNEYRIINQKVVEIYGYLGDENFGAFEFNFKNNRLFVLASAGEGWDHVSVSLKNRTPNWYEMEHVAKLFFYPTEYAVQYHVPTERHINVMENCLHWWRPHYPYVMLMPPPLMV